MNESDLKIGIMNIFAFAMSFSTIESWLKTMERESKISDFVKYNGEYSHTRLISIIGSIVVFGVFIFQYDNVGIQNLVSIIISGSLINATVSKFSKNETIRTPRSNRGNKE